MGDEIRDQYYTVELEKEGCAHCGGGKQWVIVDPNDVATSTSYDSEEDAQDLCDDMNMAYGAGVSGAFGNNLLERLGYACKELVEKGVGTNRRQPDKGDFVDAFELILRK